MNAALKRLVKQVLSDSTIGSLAKKPGVGALVCALSDRGYYCPALHGESWYNICVNCDLTVSCNCLDFDGSGHIGDLRTQSFGEIFDGEKAQHFRRQLAKGRFPIKACEECMELRWVGKQEAARYLSGFTPPRNGIMVENTVLCNLKCHFCQREQVMKTRSQYSMSLADMERVAQMVREYGIKQISFLNLGEPFISKSIYEELGLLKQYSAEVSLRSSTNGLFVDTDRKRDAAMMLDYMYFSIDGPCQEVLEKYQVGGDFERAYRNMRDLVAYRDARGATKPVIEWKYVVFCWNDSEEHVHEAVDLAQEAGVDLIAFYEGAGPPAHTSTRYHKDPFFWNLGECAGPPLYQREIYLRRR